ncbi:MATE family efflux transporter [Halodesulfovibrio marinisediminis]|uniref:Multidrug-efflux transporter n=1 Tax=Halodesulfovibrio marinisediminis DSM 17456 TaxID=1121457 RepID=A0A1N6IRD9_9BACT|nr:MATE family efflux transporter [Halodesulfovibrio marinisediminis]SIO34592.1 multidrug resistance protein, MATE family [Halodesulfovibrio marinisediminis DSM 17456]
MSNSEQITDPTSYKAIWNLAWPQILMMMFHFFIGFVDVWVAGQINPNVQAALGMISQTSMFFFVIAIAIGNGCVAAISQSLGAGLHDRAARYVGLVVILGLFCGLCISGLGWVFRHVFLGILQTPEEIYPIAMYFLKIYLVLLPVYYVFIITNAVFRAKMMVFVPMRSIAIVAIVNAIADLGFGLGWFGFPEFGYKGVAWATLLSVAGGTIYNFSVLVGSEILVKRSFAPLRWVRCALPYLVKVAAPAGGTQALWHTGYIVLFAIVASLPFNAVEALAGLAAGMRIESLLFLPAFAFNMTASILIGHFLGAGNKVEAKRVGLRILGVACGIMSLIAIGFWPFIQPMAKFLAPEPGVTVQAAVYLKYNIISIPFTVASMTLGGIMTGAGATIYNFWVYSSASWLVRLPVAYVLGHLVFKDAEGVYIAMLISQAFQSTTMFYIFMRRDWYRFSMVKRKNSTAPAV